MFYFCSKLFVLPLCAFVREGECECVCVFVVNGVPLVNHLLLIAVGIYPMEFVHQIYCDYRRAKQAFGLGSPLLLPLSGIFWRWDLLHTLYTYCVAEGYILHSFINVKTINYMKRASYIIAIFIV